MDFSLQDIGSGGWSGISENLGGNGDTGSSSSGIFSALENIGVNFAAGAAAIGLNSLGKSAGVQSSYSPYNNPANLARNPGTLPGPPRVRVGVSPNTLVPGRFVLPDLFFDVAVRKKRCCD